MIPIDRIREYLSEYSGFDLSTGDAGLEDFLVVVTCHNADAIPIALRAVGDSYIVSADLWRERYSDIDEALNCLFFFLGTNCRFKVVKHGQVTSAVTMEWLDRTLWCSDKTIRRHLVPVWRRARIDYRFNVLRPAQV